MRFTSHLLRPVLPGFFDGQGIEAFLSRDPVVNSMAKVRWERVKESGGRGKRIDNGVTVAKCLPKT